MHVTDLDLLITAGAGLAAGAVNAMAGGGTLIAFPCLLALGVPTVSANATVTVGQSPGYLVGAWAQRADLSIGFAAARRLAIASGLGAIAGAVLLQVTPNGVFGDIVPWLILFACSALLAGDRVRAWVVARTPGGGNAGRRALPLLVGVAGVYGGFFGAGLGIVLLALLGLFSDAGLVRNNAIKQVLSFTINAVAAVVFAAGHVVTWALVPTIAIGAVIGGALGSRAVRLVRPAWLRAFVVAVGVAVAVDFWVR